MSIMYTVRPKKHGHIALCISATFYTMCSCFLGRIVNLECVVRVRFSKSSLIYLYLFCVVYFIEIIIWLWYSLVDGRSTWTHLNVHSIYISSNASILYKHNLFISRPTMTTVKPLVIVVLRVTFFTAQASEMAYQNYAYWLDKLTTTESIRARKSHLSNSIWNHFLWYQKNMALVSVL